MALSGLVAYDSSDNECGSEEDVPKETKAIILPKKTTTKGSGGVCDDEDGELPKPSEKERELAEIARKEKENLVKKSGLQKMALKKNGKILIGIPSLADVCQHEVFVKIIVTINVLSLHSLKMKMKKIERLKRHPFPYKKDNLSCLQSYLHQGTQLISLQQSKQNLLLLQDQLWSLQRKAYL